MHVYIYICTSIYMYTYNYIHTYLRNFTYITIPFAELGQLSVKKPWYIH